MTTVIYAAPSIPDLEEESFFEEGMGRTRIENHISHIPMEPLHKENNFITFEQLSHKLIRLDNAAAKHNEVMEMLVVRAGEIKDKIDQFSEKLKDPPVINPLVLTDLNSEQYSLKCPLHGVIEFWTDEVVAHIPELGIYASADTDNEAILELKDEVIELYHDLKWAGSDNLGKLPQSWLRILNQTIAETI
ncbi:MAG: hypothetical protein V2A78_06470 [bacterium]